MTALRNILLALSIGVIMWMASCSNNGCEENSSSLPLAGFYSSQTKTSIAIDSLTVYGIGSPGDSAIIRNQSSTKQVYLPFDVDADCSRFVIQYNQQDLEGITDTVTVSYDRVPFFYSKDCGAFYVFDVTDYSVSHNLIDSIQVLRNSQEALVHLLVMLSRLRPAAATGRPPFFAKYSFFSVF